MFEKFTKPLLLQIPDKRVTSLVLFWKQILRRIACCFAEYEISSKAWINRRDKEYTYASNSMRKSFFRWCHFIQKPYKSAATISPSCARSWWPSIKRISYLSSGSRFERSVIWPSQAVKFSFYSKWNVYNQSQSEWRSEKHSRKHKSAIWPQS